ncbi:type II toxin-antitoxin system PemK/MazF family toxin [Fructilactobacillus fructivorans]|uniref:PpGpp-regulated growth inhibitor n=1 Tax=Fructilactobacillus fructivorans TaxID=1614 RepID=A0A0C1LZP3_9LACO|nr:type II toxin-antitoxin system PemK/MazF family toxin [Fructilactobacillus fructivorans]KID42345.1 ppGpp-regulated growth inhibitor [Fructilactobacillus fructivorans]MCT0151038.1 type II toxin-antitoxin system PemK/MazF family toxin [Fructilactobacillus fructivorans]MCT2867404.1 type II toxin-antitoxin system PemK/MazF family toxin [Fructilactobacillus fructivorans]MCT2869077.1 type II toxin-antitoxin system PemK/MazF family toxin [Fructilactobacillus fructivorans]MCT2873203.1 type II toxin
MTNSNDSNFQDGDVVWVNFSPTNGHEQQGRRPAVVVSIGDLERLAGVVWVVPITSTNKRRLSVPINANIGNHGINGQVLVGQIRSIDPLSPRRDVERVGQCPPDTLTEIHQSIDMILHQ